MKIALVETRNVYDDEMPENLDNISVDELEKIRKSNVDHHINLIKDAVSEGVNIICFGELFAYPYFALEKNELWFQAAEELNNSKTLEDLLTVSAEHDLVIVAPMYEKKDGKYYNTTVVLDSGKLLGLYRKTHIPQGTNEQGEFAEQYYFSANDDDFINEGRDSVILGDTPFYPVFDTSHGKIAVMTCYDRHFGDKIVPIFKRKGAELIFVPSVTFGEVAERMWTLESPTDAMRNRVFMAVLNRKGIEKPWGQEFFGNSYVVDPDGDRVDFLENNLPEDLLITEIDFKRINEESKSGWNLQRDLSAQLS